MKTRILLLIALCAVVANASAQYAMEMTHADGRVETLPFSKIDEISFDLLQEGVDYVDLGLPSGTLWATSNVGTSDPYETGQLFVWGKTSPFAPSRNQRTTPSMNFSQMLAAGVVDADGYLTPDFDPATLLKGSLYQTPTHNQWAELVQYCEVYLLDAHSTEAPDATEPVMLYIGPNGNRLLIVLPENYTWVSDNKYTHRVPADKNEGYYVTSYRATNGGYYYAVLPPAGDLTSPGHYNGGAWFGNTTPRAANIRPVLTIKKDSNE